MIKKIKAVTVTFKDGSKQTFEGEGTMTSVKTGTKQDKTTVLIPVRYTTITIVPEESK